MCLSHRKLKIIHLSYHLVILKNIWNRMLTSANIKSGLYSCWLEASARNEPKKFTNRCHVALQCVPFCASYRLKCSILNEQRIFDLLLIIILNPISHCKCVRVFASFFVCFSIIFYNQSKHQKIMPQRENPKILTIFL